MIVIVCSNRDGVSGEGSLVVSGHVQLRCDRLDLAASLQRTGVRVRVLAREGLSAQVRDVY